MSSRPVPPQRLAQYEKRRLELRRAMQEQGLKVMAVAKAAGMDEREFNNVLSGRRRMTDLVTRKVIAGLKSLLLCSHDAAL